MKSLRLIIGVMVLLPVWSQTVPESISNEILEELKRVEDWEVELTRAGRLAAQRDFAAAGAAYQALAQAAAKFQFPLPLQAKCLNNFAAMLHVAGRYPEAEEKYRAAAEAWKLGSGPDSEHLATTLNNLGDIYRLQGKLEKAHASLEESIRIGMAARDK